MKRNLLKSMAILVMLALAFTTHAKQYCQENVTDKNGSNPIQLTFTKLPDGNYAVVVEGTNLAGFGGSFVETNAGGGYELRAHQTVSADGTKLFAIIESTTAPTLYTPLYVMMPGEVQYDPADIEWTTCEGVDITVPEPEPEPEGENLALNKPVYAGKEGYPAKEANDGNLLSRWASGQGKVWSAEEPTTDHWWYVDLGGVYNLSELQIWFETACPTSYDISFSDDAQTWTTPDALKFTAQPTTGNAEANVNRYTLPEATQARFVRILAYTGYADLAYGISIWEFEVYGTAVADTEKPVLNSATFKSATWVTADITIDATDNIMVTACHVLDAANGIDGNYPVNGGVLTIDGLKESTTYNFTIAALDGAGNRSDNTIEVQATTPQHFTSAAPVPTYPQKQVIALYSDAYQVVDPVWSYNAGWGSPVTLTESKIGDDNILEYHNFTYLGMVGTAINAVNMEYFHIDIYADADGKLQIHPISSNPVEGGPNVDYCYAEIEFKAAQWNSFDIPLSDFKTAEGKEELVWSNIFQFKFDNGTIADFYLDNMYFYRTTPLADDEKPTDLTATAVPSFFSANITCQATDNSGVVNYEISLNEKVVAKGGGESGKQVVISVPSLHANTEYTFSVVALDENDNRTEPIEVKTTTLATPASAPAPTAKAEDVKSIYSDAYEPAAAFIIGGWGQTTIVNEGALAEGDNAFIMENSNYMGWEINSNVAFADLTGYTLHMDIYPIEGNSIIVSPISTGCEENRTPTELQLNQWNQLDVALTTYTGVNPNDIFQLKFNGMPKVMWLDNVYFYKAPTTSIEQVADQLNIRVIDHVLSVEGTDDIMVFNSVGQLITTRNHSYLPNGLYIVRAGNQVSKVIVK